MPLFRRCRSGRRRRAERAGQRLPASSGSVPVPGSSASGDSTSSGSTASRGSTRSSQRGNHQLAWPKSIMTRRHDGHADEDGIHGDAAGQPDAELLDHPVAAEDERGEDQDHDQRGGGDRLAGGGQPVAHGDAVVAARFRYSSCMRRHQEHLVVHGQAEEDGEEHDGQEGLDRARPVTPNTEPRSPHWKTATSIPKAAPMESRFMTAAVERDDQRSEHRS